jgi:hypothetical protein
MESRVIKNYENYLIYEDGNILNTKTNRKLKNVLAQRYQVVLLYKNGVRKMFYVHRLVAEAFCNKKVNANQVNHIDSNKTNNHYCNLEWVTSKENVTHYIKSPVYKKRNISEYQKLRLKEAKYKKVKCLISGKIYKCITDFALDRKISMPQASQKLNGVLKNNLNAILLTCL